MPFTITEFKSKLNTETLQRSHNYEFWVQPPWDKGEALKHFAWTTESISLPGASFVSVSNYRPYGAGRVWDVPYAFNPQEISSTHLIDGNSTTIAEINRWVNYIIRTGRDATAHYMDEYTAASAVIKLYDEHGKKAVTQYELFECFPMSVDQVQLGWANEEIARVNVTWRYTDYKIS